MTETHIWILFGALAVIGYLLERIEKRLCTILAVLMQMPDE